MTQQETKLVLGEKARTGAFFVPLPSPNGQPHLTIPESLCSTEIPVGPLLKVHDGLCSPGDHSVWQLSPWKHWSMNRSTPYTDPGTGFQEEMLQLRACHCVDRHLLWASESRRKPIPGRLCRGEGRRRSRLHQGNRLEKE